MSATLENRQAANSSAAGARRAATYKRVARESPSRDVPGRIGRLDWHQLSQDLDSRGCALIERLLTAHECNALAGHYSQEDLFRSRVVMSRHGFGRGEYQYFAYPLPDVIASLRTSLYRCLAPIANRWNDILGSDLRYPGTHADFLLRCHEAGQLRPTPLLLRYGVGDYNCLHQDIYGEHVFP